METYALFRHGNCPLQTRMSAPAFHYDLKGNLGLTGDFLSSQVLPFTSTLRFSASMLQMLVQSRKAELDHSASNLSFKFRFKSDSIDDATPVHQHMPYTLSIACYRADAPDDLTPDFDIDRMLESLQSHFEHLAYFDLKSYSCKRPTPAYTGPEALSERPNGYFSNLCDQNLLKCCIDSKQISIEFQDHLKKCLASEVHQVSIKLSPFIKELITHQFGNYVIQRLAIRDLDFQRKLATFCHQSLSEIINDEFASRVIQSLIEHSPKFRLQLQHTVAHQPNMILSSNPAVHAVSTCIRNAENSSESAYVLDWLRHDPNLFWNKGFQKLLTHFVIYCSEKQLDETYSEIKIENFIESYMKVKLLAYLLINLVQRNHGPTIEALKKALKRDPAFALTTLCFKLMVAKSWEDQNSSSTQVLSEILISLGKNHTKRLWSNSKVMGCFYIYITIKTLRTNKAASLMAFIRREDIARQLKTMLRYTRSVPYNN